MPWRRASGDRTANAVIERFFLSAPNSESDQREWISGRDLHDVSDCVARSECRCLCTIPGSSPWAGGWEGAVGGCVCRHPPPAGSRFQVMANLAMAHPLSCARKWSLREGRSARSGCPGGRFQTRRPRVERLRTQTTAKRRRAHCLASGERCVHELCGLALYNARGGFHWRNWGAA